jgi:hypothetical protein
LLSESESELESSEEELFPLLELPNADSKTRRGVGDFRGGRRETVDPPPPVSELESSEEDLARLLDLCKAGFETCDLRKLRGGCHGKTVELLSPKLEPSFLEVDSEFDSSEELIVSLLELELESESDDDESETELSDSPSLELEDSELES